MDYALRPPEDFPFPLTNVSGSNLSSFLCKGEEYGGGEVEALSEDMRGVIGDFGTSALVTLSTPL